MRFSIALLLAGLAICTCEPARAQSAADALAALCPTRQSIAPLVEAAAAEEYVRPVVLVAVARAESTCDPSAVNRRTGALGLLQIMPGRSADPDHLERGELLDPETNARLGAAHLRRCLNLCGTLGGGLHVYNGGQRCKDWRKGTYARKVLGLIAQARRWLSRQGARVG